MQSLEEKTASNKVVVKTCYITDFIYLAVHIIYMFFFIYAKLYIMIGFNIASIIVYLLFIILLKKGKYYIYALCCGNEFLIFMSAGTITCGFNAGFQLCIIGLCVVSFYTTYFSKKKVIYKSIIWVAISLVLYLILHFYCSFNAPVYNLEKWISVTLYSIHSVAVFGFIASYLVIFVKYALTLENRIINESRIDNLTKIHNRYDLYNYLDSIENKTDYMLSIFDIDDFKQINDAYGHICGDFILKELARLAKNTLSDSFVSRYGGEEFVVITKMYSDFDEAALSLEKFREDIENHIFMYGNDEIHITITIGVEQYSNNIKTEEWINLADKKLYRGKNSGKNITVKY